MSYNDTRSEADVVAVIRSADERTAKACRTLLRRQLDRDRVHVVREVPFERALRRCYEIGAESGTKWMLTVDADVLLLPDGVRRLVRIAEELPAHYAQVEGRVYDKLFGIFRPAGHRVYRTSLLQHAIQGIPAEGATLRPESETLQALSERGFLSRRHFVVAGIHDFEQSYVDLYRKAYVFAQKHQCWLDRLVSRCVESRRTDDDFSVTMKGLSDGLKSEELARIDTRPYEAAAGIAMQELGLEEKPPLRFANSDTLEAWIEEQVPSNVPPVTVRDTPDPFRRRTRISKLKACYRQCGVTRTARFKLGDILLQLGRHVQGGTTLEG